MVRCLALVFLGVSTATAGWERLPPLPDPVGVAGAFAGASNGRLLVAGGANFPDKKPWDGGTKVWHEAVYVLDKPDGTWKRAGKLPRTLGYGASITHRDSVICVGGSDKDRHYAECFRMSWKDGELKFAPLPPLPRPLANSCGALVGETVFVAGGLEKPDSPTTLRVAFALDLAAANPRWTELPAWPGPPRMLAVAASSGGAFWLVGGVDLEAGPDGKPRRKYLRDTYRYVPGQGWTRVADLPHPVAAAPSPCPSDDSSFLILGGDDGSNVGFAPPEKHPGFTKKVLRFDRKLQKWSAVGECASPRVTVTVVKWRDRWVIPSGEVRPGVRSPEVWTFQPDAMPTANGGQPPRPHRPRYITAMPFPRTRPCDAIPRSDFPASCRPFSRRSMRTATSTSPSSKRRLRYCSPMA